MFLNEVHEQLCSGELSLLAEGEKDVLSPSSLPKTNALIQAGYADLNKKFAIRENSLLLRTQPGQEVYELVPSNAVSSGNPDAFIIDSTLEPFTGDIMQIFSILGGSGQSLFMNTDGINMLSYNTLRLHKGTDLGDLLVNYKAKAKQLDFTLPADQVYIDLPNHFLYALVLYVASRKYNPRGSETIGRGMFHEGNNYWSKYIEECNDLKNNLGSIASTGETPNFVRNGWV